MSVCPRCDVQLTGGEAYGVKALSCGRCGGWWLDPADLRAILDAAPARAEKPAARAPVDLTRAEGRPCPRCRTPMGPFNYAGDSGVILDKCDGCGGLWLDPGELERVLATVAASEADIERDEKRFSADLHRAEVRQDALEQRDARTIPDALTAALADEIADAGPGP